MELGVYKRHLKTFNVFPTNTPYVSKVDFTIILPPMPRSSLDVFRLKFCMHFSVLWCDPCHARSVFILVLPPLSRVPILCSAQSSQCSQTAKSIKTTDFWAWSIILYSKNENTKFREVNLVFYLAENVGCASLSTHATSTLFPLVCSLR